MATQNKPIPETPCPNCNLFTPVWRDYCIHCGYRLAAGPASDSEKASAVRIDRPAA
jgi:hypothetical protein